MKIAIMQPYFLPYLGYFQLLNAVKKFVVYDNIQYSKKGWINRNRILSNGVDSMFTIPLEKSSDYLDVNQRSISEQFIKVERDKILRRIRNEYKNAPSFESVMPLVERVFNYPELNLFEYIYYSIKEISNYLEITTQLQISSKINIDHNLKSQKKVLEICKALHAQEYINPIGGLELYSKKEFLDSGIKLMFMKTNSISYQQFNNEFLPNLSIIDVLMFNSKEEIQKMLQEYELI
ncbi:WbqC-like protein [Ulvibacter sp. MAR_2010_11]|uniref:WbqC family protein n=1 Tax=Ulvibacter sp. MAR_2010_11 TaxID=1250229 RepID=UPI000C2C5996|nr:WbqC family protein [Ulvibacter sp. MAR_2010_11]PKA82137.1 WbqC-like protein [Ulvibacter sp. MAR_2010_11]